jgi:hypothetical protein
MSIKVWMDTLYLYIDKTPVIVSRLRPLIHGGGASLQAPFCGFLAGMGAAVFLTFLQPAEFRLVGILHLLFEAFALFTQFQGEMALLQVRLLLLHLLHLLHDLELGDRLLHLYRTHHVCRSGREIGSPAIILIDRLTRDL